MHREFRRLLDKAVGVSEFVVAVNVDIRGFSEFSKTVDSADTAVFIKKIYMKLIDEYFKDASFVKPTGDGLLVIIPFKETTLAETVNKVAITCLSIVDKFSEFCSKDPMVTYPTPQNVGIGISRGSACKIVSGSKTVDYSGRVLNMASRLMDMARPKGIVFDASFGFELLSEDIKKMFKPDSVYIQGISERETTAVFFRKDATSIPAKYKQRFEQVPQIDSWVYPFKEIKHFDSRFWFQLKKNPISSDSIKMRLTHDKMVNGKVKKGFSSLHTFDDFIFRDDMGVPEVGVTMQTVISALESQKIKKTTAVTFEAIYQTK